jgi:hypothetical protein
MPLKGEGSAMPTSGTASPERRFFRGVPTFFRLCCIEASLERQGGYRHPGYHLGLHIAEMLEPDDNDGPEIKLEELGNLLDARDDAGVLAFLRREFPACMKLVPAPRRRQFLQGVYFAHEHGRVV